MAINEERFRNALTNGSLRSAGSELLAQLDECKSALGSSPLDVVKVQNNLGAAIGKAYTLIGTYSDTTNPEPLPKPTQEVKPEPITEPVVEMPETNSEMPVAAV